MRKHVVCFGDSNTHGYCAECMDCADGGMRFNEEERWTCLLQKILGDKYLILEEGMNGRTTVFEDPLFEKMSGIDSITACLMSHEPVDLLIIMLGTNDTKERFGATAAQIALGMERLIRKAKGCAAWKNDTPNILVIAPPPVSEKIIQGPEAEFMGRGCAEKSRALAKRYQEVCQRTGSAFLDAAGHGEFNHYDYMHFTREGHAEFASYLAKQVLKLTK